jgi:glucose-1-phosphate adenylyltransferase
MESEGKKYLASMGIYIFNEAAAWRVNDDPETKDFGKEIIPQAVGNRNILSYRYEGYWTNIGNIDSFFETNIRVDRDIPQFNLFDNDNKIYASKIIAPSKFQIH